MALYRFTNGLYGVNEHGTFQQYALGYADVTGKVGRLLVLNPSRVLHAHRCPTPSHSMRQPPFRSA